MRMIILKLAYYELFCFDFVVSGIWLMIFQSSCKHRIAASFAFKQKRSLQLSVQPTLRFQVLTYCNNSRQLPLLYSHSSTALAKF